MKLLTFKGGIHPPYNKEYTNQIALRKAEAPKVVYIPLQQHIGAPAKPIVEVGDEVKKGQKIGEPQGFVSTYIHSSVSGKVIAIEQHEIPGGRGLCVVIENDFKEELDESVVPKGDLETLDAKDIIKFIQEAGIVGMGGATFPTHVKLSPPPDTNIDVVILNGAECEPYLTADHRLMVEYPEDVVFGIRVIMKASVERIEQTEFIESSFQQGNYLKTLKTHKTLLQTIDLIPYSQNTPLFINPLNFKIEKGEIWQLTGPNGCGKSILLKCFIHYHENFSGTIQLAKDTLVAYVPQESFLFEGTVKDNLLKGLQQPQLEQLTYFIQLFKFDVPLTQKVTPFNLNLSSGQLQKIKLIRALLSKPDILLLDEVFANLDTTTVNTLITYIQEIKLTTVFVYHGNLSQLISKENYHQILIFKTETKGLFSHKIMS